MKNSEVFEMRDEYDIRALHPRENPYAKKLKKQITINIDADTVDYFKGLSAESGIPYQTLMNLYLSDCAEKHRKPTIAWT